MSGDVHVRFRERLGGRFPGATRCNVYVRSRKAGERVMALLRKCYGKLRLKVNEAKSAVASVKGRKFLGYSFWFAKEGVKLSVVNQIDGPLVTFFEGPSDDACSALFHNFSDDLPRALTACAERRMR